MDFTQDGLEHGVVLPLSVGPLPGCRIDGQLLLSRADFAAQPSPLQMFSRIRRLAKRRLLRGQDETFETRYLRSAVVDGASWALLTEPEIDRRTTVYREAFKAVAQLAFRSRPRHTTAAVSENEGRLPDQSFRVLLTSAPGAPPAPSSSCRPIEELRTAA